MLVLSRKHGESLVIRDDIIITVVEIRGDKVRLGVVAPRDVSVHRQEVYEAIHGRPEYAPWAPSPAAYAPWPPEPPVEAVVAELDLALAEGAQVRFTPEGGFVVVPAPPAGDHGPDAGPPR